MRLITKDLLYVLWSIGAFLLLWVINNVTHTLQRMSAMTFQPVYWPLVILYLLLGGYIGLLFVRKWTFRVNLPLIIFVSLPSLLFNPDIFFSLHISLPWVKSIPEDLILGIISGATLINGVLGNKSE